MSQGYKFINHRPAHRVIMENFLGRKLNSNEHIHHINGNRADNRIENLKIVTSQKEHSREHLKDFCPSLDAKGEAGHCLHCNKLLTGKQEKFCGHRCRMNHWVWEKQKRNRQEIIQIHLKLLNDNLEILGLKPVTTGKELNEQLKKLRLRPFGINE